MGDKEILKQKVALRTKCFPFGGFQNRSENCRKFVPANRRPRN